MVPVVSIILAAHLSNEKHLRSAIESVIAQTFPDWELIVSDDSASNTIKEICLSYGETRLRYSAWPKPLGPYRNHAVGFEAALGRFFAVLNHDDIYYPDFLESMMRILSSNGSSLAFSDHAVIDNEGKTLPELTSILSERWGRSRLSSGLQRDIEGLFLNQSIPAMAASLYDRRLIQGYDELDAGPAYDLWITSLFVRNGAIAAFSPGQHSAWRSHGSSITSQGNLAWSEGTASVWQRSIEWLRVPKNASIARSKAAYTWALHSLSCARRGYWKDADKAARKSWKLTKTSRGLIARLVSISPTLGSRLCDFERRIRSKASALFIVAMVTSASPICLLSIFFKNLHSELFQTS